MTFAVASVCTASLFAQESAPAADENEIAEEVELSEAEEEKSWSVGVDMDYFSAYVWRSAVQNDRQVFQPCVWGEWNFFGPLSIGGSVWQNWDLTNQRRSSFSKTFVNETDYNVFLGLNAWKSEEEEYSLDFQLGHDWYTYHGVNDRAGYPNTRELYVKATFENPIVTVYGQASWMYEDNGDYKRGMYYEVGFNKEVELESVEGLSLGVDWNVGMGDKNYNDFLFGEDKLGFGGTTVKTYASYALLDWVSVKGTLAYTGVINGSMRNSIGDQGDEYDFHGGNYPRDLLWGGVSLNFEF